MVAVGCLVGSASELLLGVATGGPGQYVCLGVGG